MLMLKNMNLRGDQLTSINDVAKQAGVSIATVSKVINNYPNISIKTRNKVNIAIEKLSYRPNIVARSLVKRRSWTIGIFLHNVFTNPFVSELLVGVKQSLHNSGYDLIYLSMMMDDPNYSFIKHCRSRNVDGLLVFGLDRDNPRLKDLIHEDIPTMFIDTDLIGKRAGYITADNRNGIMLAIDHLYELSHRKIAFISGNLDYIAGRDRFEGYQQGLKMYALPYSTSYIQFGHYTIEGGFKAMNNLLELPNRPSAIICTSDLMAIGAINAILAYGLSVPDDFSVVGFDNTLVAKIHKPSLTTVNQNIASMGTKAIEYLILMIEDKDFSPPVITEPVNLIVRQSTGPIGR
jgi:LacI family transcriptional regulator